MHNKGLGFTIVELLVVIVVIGILAAITIVSYTGISSKATVASLQSDLDNASKQLKLDQVINSGYPTTLANANGGKGIPASAGTTYEYTVDNTTNPQSFCIAATKGTVTYKVTNNEPPVVGNCHISNIVTDGLVINLDAGDTSSYPGTGTDWTDLGGLGNHGTLVNGVTYNSANQGALVFDGVNDYVDTLYSNGSMANTTFEAFIYDTKLSSYRSIIQVNVNSDDGVYISPAGVLTFWPCVSSNLTVPGNQWVYVAVTYDGSKIVYYVNGNSQTVNTACADITDFQFIRVGAYGGYDSEIFKGNIAIARVYNRALSSSEIQQNFDDARDRYGL